MNPFIEIRDISIPQSFSDVGSMLSCDLFDQLSPKSSEIIRHILRRADDLGDHNPQKIVLGRDEIGFTFIETTDNGSYSIAIDIGTTNIAGILYDNVTKKELLSLSVENPQIVYGSDILTRMHAAMYGRYHDVYAALNTGINALIADLCFRMSIETESIHGLVVAGNTALSHFFLGLDVSSIPVAPFVPAVQKPGFVNARDIGLNIHPAASVYVFPNAGSYVGGDIVAGIIASGMADTEDVSVLIDVGTNAEIVVGNSEWILVGAGAAGPALEEGISMAGRRAGDGVIYDVEIKKEITKCRTFDGREPRGICGSGMVSLVYELFQRGIIDEKGMLQEDRNTITLENGEAAFLVRCNEYSTPITIRQTEIDNFLRSKAAMFTLLLVILRTVGLEFRDIGRVYVAGALGTGINIDKALGIGMLPGWNRDSFVLLGNSSLAGAKLLLSDASILGKIERVTDSITYKHMHDDPEFMKEFMGSVFLPHTNPSILDI